MRTTLTLDDELLATATVTVFEPANVQGFVEGNSNE